MGILPNLGGPKESIRRVYLGVVRSIALYGAPMWSTDLMASRRSISLLHKVQRRLAIRVVRGYRTISFEAATLLSRLPPFELLAEADAEAYFSVRRARQGGGVSAGVTVEARRQARLRALDKWHTWLFSPRYVHKPVVEAVLPNFWDWLDRGHASLTFRLTQVLTGHGCFGEYLHGIGREATAVCHHCGHGEDTAQHTLEFCPA
ncbi:uncharacterized protein LOC108631306 [Ceratina calcarata]|uniref:Uncharacterized protein LOC108631306 n=1 Tax=Ceratina calcarata TaxID=156304 RepID=A0AAJ7JE77_9HYME|nr:uncharacterized protein LOC108631306 [Ceratina calcarata]